MPAIFWYAGVAVIGIVSSIYVIINERKTYKISTLIMFYLFIAGFSWICEFIVLGLFDAYQYKIDVFENRWAQNLLGHLILNTTIYPSAALVTITRKRRKLTIFFYMVFMTLIEYIFVRQGVYEHHWWHYYMTTLTIAVILIIAVFWFDRIKQGCKGLPRAATFFFIALILLHTPAPVLLLLGKQYYHLSVINHVFGDRFLSSIIVIFTYHLLESLEVVFFTCILKKWYFKLLPFVVSVFMQCLFLKLNILVLQDEWRIFYTLCFYDLAIAIFMMAEKKTLLKPAAAVA